MSANQRRLVAFTALAGFASFHWFGLMADFDSARWLAVVLIAALGGGALLYLSGRSRVFAAAGAVGVLIAMTVAGLAAVGIPLRLLAPGGWGELSDELNRGLAGVSQIETPYPGPEQWTRIGVLAAAPLAVAVGMTAAFWPTAKGRAGRGLGLVILVTLYASAVTWEAPSAELVRGAALFVIVAAVLWFPSMRLSRAASAVTAVLVAVLAALPLASTVDASDPVVSYTKWHLFGDEARITFNWNHTYGSLDWPQEGTDVFEVTTDKPLYWKTFVLDDFNGSAWGRERDGFGVEGDELDLAGVPSGTLGAHPEWLQTFSVKMQALQTRLAVTAGTNASIDGVETSNVSGDGTTTSLDFEIPSGTEYSVSTYVPDPSAKQLRRVDRSYPAGSERYTTLTLPEALNHLERQIDRPAPIGLAVVPPQGVDFTHAERSRAPQSKSIDKIVAGTPYERVLRLARRLTDGARTDYAAVARVQRFLLANYTYDQDVPLTRNPLPAFLLHDRAGYCQHFAGAMTLMLRMVGIPSRVVSGFAPGVPNDGGTYTVQDTDAHSWVEVLFPGIGWVTVDPTPSTTPAHTDVTVPGSDAASARLGRSLGKVFNADKAPAGGLRGVDQGATTQAEEDRGSPVPLLVTLALAASAVAIVVRRRRRLRSPAGADLQLRELERALVITGRAPPPGATLLGIQRQLSSTLGADAARYAAGLRESRYGRRRRDRPGPAERRSFRWALARHSGFGGWWRALRAVPPGGPSARM